MYNDLMGSHVSIIGLYIYYVMGRAAESTNDMYNDLMGSHVSIVGLYIYYVMG